MREIKFRAWDKKGRFEMSEVIIIDFHDKYVVVNDGWNKDLETGEEECVANFDEIELMQYTGLKDKNGVEIYENDVMRYDLGDREAELEGEENRYSYCTVIFEGGAFCEYTDGCIDYLSDGSEDVLSWEVIGNTYENPELLGGK